MSPVLIALIVICISFCLLHLYKFSKMRPKNFPPGPPRLPIWGSYWFLLKENYTFSHISTEMLAKKYNTDLLGLFLGPVPCVIAFGNERCKEVLSKEEFFGRNDTIVTRGRSLGDLLGIFFIDGPHWQEQRRFSLRHLRDYGFGRRYQSTEELFEKEMRDVIEFLTSEPAANDLDCYRKKGQVLIPDLFYAPVLNALLHMLVGRRFDNKEMREIARAILRFLRSGDATGCAITLTPWLRYIAPDYFGYTPIVAENKRLTDFFKKQIFEHKLNFSDDHLADFTDVFLNKIKELQENGDTDTKFTDKQLLWTLIDYMFPAPLAIGQTLSYLFAYLLNYPDIQSKLQAEIDNVVGRCRLPHLDDRKNMPYTEAVIRESLRSDPINPLGIPRRCMKTTTLGGYVIPENTVILSHLWSAHNDPKCWGDPENFRPERFLDTDGNLLKKDPSIAFGAGKRLCAGETFARQLMFLLVTGLFQNFTFKAADKIPDPKVKVWGILLSIQAFWAEAVPR